MRNRRTPPTRDGSHLVRDIDWELWHPVDRGTLVFVVRDQEILLIHKKRGLGAGKINGPGGRLDDGETPLDCALRELNEELRVAPKRIREKGELLFQFVDGYSIHVWVFRADDCEGTPTETDEAVPLWVSLDAIPYKSMWPDDRIWLPILLQDRSFHGRFVFDQDTMLDFEIQPEVKRLS